MALVVLNRQKAALKGQITRIETFVKEKENISSEVNSSEFEVKLQGLNKQQISLDYLKLQYYEKVEQDADIEALDEEFVELESRIENLQVTIHSFLTCKNATNVVENRNIHSNNNSIVRLPEISIPKFSGKIEEFNTFKLQFDNIITNNTNLDANQKLQYLNSALVGEARNLITINDTFVSLSNALKERYYNNRVLVDLHIKQILEFEKIKFESTRDLRRLIDVVNKSLRALSTLKLEKDNLSDILLLNIVLTKIDRESRKQYELSISSKEIPKLDELLLFLEKRCQILENLGKVSISNPNPKPTKSKSFLVKSETSLCKLCNEVFHPIYVCNKFKEMDANSRFDIVKKFNLCIICLNRFHRMSECRAKSFCSICRKRHHTMLCFQKLEKLASRQGINANSPIVSDSTNNNVNNEKNISDPVVNNIIATSSFVSSQKSKYVLLATAIVYITDDFGSRIPCRALLDNGSMSNFCTSNMVNILSLKSKPVNISVSALNNVGVKVKSKVNTTISNKNGDFQKTLEFLVVPKITDFCPSKCLDISNIAIPKNVVLADPQFFRSNKIDLLIGADTFFELLNLTKIKIENSQLSIFDTVFGFVISGSIDTPNESIVYCGLTGEVTELHDSIKRFWELEEINLTKPFTSEEKECEEHFTRNFTRNLSGRFCVKLPFKGNDKDLGYSKNISIRRFLSVEKRLECLPQKELYHNFLEEYLRLGHMELIPPIERAEVLGKTNYLPHHFVLKESSTTALRVVFDASVKTSNGIALNNLLMVGPKLQEDIFDIICRFRLHKFVFTADIAKMYRQILVSDSDADMQRIVWRSSRDQPLEEYRLKTITYGTASAPFLAIRSLKQLALEEEEGFPLASKVLLSDVYVDDILSGAQTLETALELQNQLIQLLKSGGMKLYKWSSNSRELSQNVPFEDREYHFDNTKETVKTLGIKWNPDNDCYQFSVSQSTDNVSVCTKRSVFSEIAKLFDPLGLLGPIIVRAKIFMQQLWLLKLDWDDPLPEKEEKLWKNFISSLHFLQSIKISRFILSDFDNFRVELHGFSDSSKDAYGAVIYLRCSFPSGQDTVNLICSKSRVAPLKTVSIPRLELCAAVLLAKLIKRTSESLKLNIDKIALYSDSKIVLAWIRSEPRLLKTFVANRITTIQQLTNSEQWLHVSSANNPSDLISRGVDSHRLVMNDLWWTGPAFLKEPDYKPETQSTDDECLNTEDYCDELKGPSVVTLHARTFNCDFVNYLLSITNDYAKLIRIISYIYRFIRLLRKQVPTGSTSIKGPIAAEELRNAEIWLFKTIQVKGFPNEFASLRKGDSVSSNSKLKGLNPFIDENQLLRVGGRLVNSDLKFDQKHPIILPKGDKLTRIIFEYFHKKNHHAGPQTLLYAVRQEFWPISGRLAARKVVKECVICFKQNPKPAVQIMGNLPPDRVNPSAPFNIAGCDFCGPFFIREKYQRKSVLKKIYVAIFICLTTKAVHIELVSDLTSESFIACLKRFFARRGKSAVIYTDNATNFVGACAELRRLHKLVTEPNDQLGNYFSTERISWKFIPPRSPNFGGLWEASVKSFKYYLKRTASNANLSYEEFLTVIAQIEAILNSRPICPLSSNPNDLEALSPGHFLIGRPLNSIPEPELLDIKDNRLSRWQLTTKIVQSIWKRWQRDYLNNLQQRSKWNFEKDNVNEGDVVLIKDDNLPPAKWALGRIKNTIKGPDGKVRVVMIQTPTCVLKRTVTKVCILPIQC